MCETITKCASSTCCLFACVRTRIGGLNRLLVKKEKFLEGRASYRAYEVYYNSQQSERTVELTLRRSFKHKVKENCQETNTERKHSWGLRAEQENKTAIAEAYYFVVGVRQSRGPPFSQLRRRLLLFGRVRSSMWSYGIPPWRHEWREDALVS